MDFNLNFGNTDWSNMNMFGGGSFQPQTEQTYNPSFDMSGSNWNNLNSFGVGQQQTDSIYNFNTPQPNNFNGFYGANGPSFGTETTGAVGNWDPQAAPGSWDQTWQKMSSGQQGVDNAFRLGQAGLSLGQIFLAKNAMKKEEEGRQKALDYIQSNRDPNSAFYQAELKRMMGDPNGYLTDVSTQNQNAAAREAAMRQASLQGRASLTPDELKALQTTAAGAYNNRIKTLSDLVGKDQQLLSAGANIMASPLQSQQGFNQAVIGGLGGLWTNARDFAGDMGWATKKLPAPNNPTVVNKYTS